MAAANTVSDLQAVDFGFGRVLVAAYEGLAPRGPAAFQRFLSRDNATKIFRADNEDLRTLLIRIAGKVSNGNALPDLPVIAYYRSPGLSGSDEKPRSYDLTRYSDEGTTKIKLTAVPVEISYSIAFCAWDKPTLDSLTMVGVYRPIRKAAQPVHRAVSPGRRKAGYGSEGLFDGDAGHSYRQRQHGSG